MAGANDGLQHNCGQITLDVAGLDLPGSVPVRPVSSAERLKLPERDLRNTCLRLYIGIAN